MGESSKKSPMGAGTQGDAAGAGSAGTKRRRSKAGSKPKPKKLPPFNVVLLDDDDHSYEYVIGMLAELFAHPMEKGFKLAKTVDKDGRAIVMTTHKELAELKRDQILAYGADVRIASSKGSMSATIEPAN